MKCPKCFERIEFSNYALRVLECAKCNTQVKLAGGSVSAFAVCPFCFKSLSLLSKSKLSLIFECLGCETILEHSSAAMLKRFETAKKGELTSYYTEENHGQS